MSQRKRPQNKKNLRFKIREKSLASLWLEAERTLDLIVIANNLGQCPFELMRTRVLNEVLDNLIDVFECVAVPAIDTTKSVLRLRVSRAFELAVTEATNRLVLSDISHGNHLH